MKKVSGVIFDMDGLILDTEMIYFKTNQKIAAEYGLKNYDIAYYRTEIGLGEEHVHQKYLNDFSYLPKETINQFFDVTRQDIQKTLKEDGAPIKEGIVELLTYLKENSIPCVVASSNNEETIKQLLTKANLLDYFKAIVSSDEVAHAKPDPEIVEIALKKLGTKASETVMLEDSLNGIRAAFSANVPVIMVPDLIEPNEEVREKAYDVKRSLLDVLTFIKEI